MFDSHSTGVRFPLRINVFSLFRAPYFHLSQSYIPEVFVSGFDRIDSTNELSDSDVRSISSHNYDFGHSGHRNQRRKCQHQFPKWDDGDDACLDSENIPAVSSKVNKPKCE